MDGSTELRGNVACNGKIVYIVGNFVIDDFMQQDTINDVFYGIKKSLDRQLLKIQSRVLQKCSYYFHLIRYILVS